MHEETHGSKLKDALITMLAVWLCLIAAGLAGARWQPGPVGAVISITVCVGLLYAWGQWSGPGRRTALLIYLLAGLLYPVLTIVALLALPTALVMGQLDWFAAGMAVGYQPHGGADTSLEFYIVPMVLNLIGPILAMGTLRAWRRGDLTT